MWRVAPDANSVRVLEFLERLKSFLGNKLCVLFAATALTPLVPHGLSNCTSNFDGGVCLVLKSVDALYCSQERLIPTRHLLASSCWQHPVSMASCQALAVRSEQAGQCSKPRACVQVNLWMAGEHGSPTVQACLDPDTSAFMLDFVTATKLYRQVPHLSSGQVRLHTKGSELQCGCA